MEQKALKEKNNIEKAWELFLKDKKNTEAKNKLTIYYLALIKTPIERISFAFPGVIEKEKLVTVAIDGLKEALNQYHPNCGITFEIYATVTIQKAFLAELEGLKQILSSSEKKMKQLQNVYKKLEKKLGRFASDEEVADYFNINLKDLDLIMKEVAPATILSLSPILNKLGTFLQTDTEIRLQNIKQRELKGILIQALHELSESEKKVIILLSYKELTLQETAQVLNISKSEVSPLYAKAILKLKIRLNTFLVEGLLKIF